LIEIARRDFGEQATFHVADLAHSLDFIRSESIDLIVSSLALHYVEDWFALFTEFSRILTPKGIIVFTTHHPSASRRWMDLLNYFERKKVTEVWQVDDQQILVSYYHRSLTEMVDAFGAGGFLIEKLLEPQPEDKVKEIDPLRYYYLSTKEHFIGFRLIRGQSI
jgi:SAM-dependent methyltransferase